MDKFVSRNFGTLLIILFVEWFLLSVLFLNQRFCMLYFVFVIESWKSQ